MQLDEISKAGLPGPIPPRRPFPPFEVGLKVYTAPLLVSTTDCFKLFHFQTKHPILHHNNDTIDSYGKVTHPHPVPTM
jgi:hypothetical protein